MRGENNKLEKDISWKELSLSHLDPHPKEYELEVQKIVNLQSLANQLPDAFTDPKRVTKSHILTVNAPIKIDVPDGQPIVNDSKACMKRGRPIGSKDKNPPKKKGAKSIDGLVENNLEKLATPEESLDNANVPILSESQVPEICENDEISINYVMNGIRWD
ncbi:uncharacterized protein LOC114740120 [Neltuma alba]|uniref:uncharacterized protein LOC114740120 n=1 Tax=Neltuma alba TaxID=207710 RepID=UPI0010A48C1B|nr:uncharacterized protein LOC114740120 [Prosopis alba]